ncbi:MAG TPA: tyrosine-type recombinase/integrase [Aquella sp.]|nr:tyrosine-type recombinase/integrase [Aquella sp.]
MNTQDIETLMTGLLQKMKSDGYSKEVMSNTIWIINHFKKYCTERGIITVTIPVMAEFLREKYDVDYYAPSSAMQTVLRRPILILYEFYLTGTFCKTHQKEKTISTPTQFKDFYLKFRDFINSQDIVVEGKKRKLWVMSEFLMYLNSTGINDITTIEVGTTHTYVNTLDKYARSTKHIIVTVLRETLEWLYSEKLISFTGRKAFPLVRKAPDTQILSYFSKEEIQRLLNSIHVDCRHGKRDLAILSILVCLGLRVSDVTNLKFSSLDWNNNVINITQLKTNNLVTLPFLDDVKIPLIDYLKNERRAKSSDEEYVFISTYAPFNKLATSSLQRIVNKYMDKAEIDYSTRHHGPHALRHSLATNLMNNNVPISAISSVLGHANTRSTEIYLTVDERNLKNLSLEVPDV